MKRIFLLITIATFVALFTYANLRHVNPSASLAPIDVRTMTVENPHSIDMSDYEKHIRTNAHIHACKWDSASSTLGLTYEYQSITDKELMDCLSLNGQLNVQQKVFETSNMRKCPVDGLLTYWEKTMSFMRLNR